MRRPKLTPGLLAGAVPFQISGLSGVFRVAAGTSRIRDNGSAWVGLEARAFDGWVAVPGISTRDLARRIMAAPTTAARAPGLGLLEGDQLEIE